MSITYTDTEKVANSTCVTVNQCENVEINNVDFYMFSDYIGSTIYSTENSLTPLGISLNGAKNVSVNNAKIKIKGINSNPQTITTASLGAQNVNINNCNLECIYDLRPNYSYSKVVTNVSFWNIPNVKINNTKIISNSNVNYEHLMCIALSDAQNPDTPSNVELYNCQLINNSQNGFASIFHINSPSKSNDIKFFNCNLVAKNGFYNNPSSITTNILLKNSKYNFSDSLISNGSVNIQEQN